ncbi:MAG: hypothetical protein D6778_01720 [Nitrospirae bacterium]|nr:MAG: hypothetical protein D6778_01720 [Nitrospirota bacterium]
MKMSLQYILDSNGKRIAVILQIEEYNHILEKLEELEALKAYDEAKSSKEEAIPFEQAVEEIERSRR